MNAVPTIAASRESPGSEVLDFGNGSQVTVTRWVLTDKHYDQGSVIEAARALVADAKESGKPTGDLTLSLDQYKRFLRVL
jgi:hypothetical protein